MNSPSDTTPRADAGAFSIVSYNTRHGLDMRGVIELRAAGWIASWENPRFAGFQEVDQKTSRIGGADTCAILAKTLGMHATFAKAISFGGGEYGNALLSREEPLDVRRIPLPGAEPRVLLLCEFDDCWVGVTHLAVDSDEAREASVAIIRDAVAACAPKPVFLMGDWNATPDSPVLRELRTFLSILSDETTATFHGADFDPAKRHNPSHCIDYIAVDAAHRDLFALRGRRVIEQRTASDHAPQVVEVAPLPAAGGTRSCASAAGGTRSCASEAGGTRSCASEAGGTRSGASAAGGTRSCASAAGGTRSGASEAGGTRSCASEALPEGAFTVATFNVRCPGDQGNIVWYRRMPRISRIVRDHGFDIFGVQECVDHQAAILDTDLHDYARVGCGRNADRGGEAMYIYYRKNRFELIEDGTFWLSGTPDEPGSRLPGAGCPRDCTWGLFADRVTGRLVRVYNTHLDLASPALRREEMRILLEHGVEAAKARGEAVFLMGDFNETLDDDDTPDAAFRLRGPALAARAEGNAVALASLALVDTYASALLPHAGPVRTCHGYKDEPTNRIDYIFASPNVRVLAHATLTDKPEGEFASDHYPVAATVEVGSR